MKNNLLLNYIQNNVVTNAKVNALVGVEVDIEYYVVDSVRGGGTFIDNVSGNVTTIGDSEEDVVINCELVIGKISATKIDNNTYCVRLQDELGNDLKVMFDKSTLEFDRNWTFNEDTREVEFETEKFAISLNDLWNFAKEGFNPNNYHFLESYVDNVPFSIIDRKEIKKHWYNIAQQDRDTYTISKLKKELLRSKGYNIELVGNIDEDGVEEFDMIEIDNLVNTIDYLSRIVDIVEVNDEEEFIIIK